MASVLKFDVWQNTAGTNYHPVIQTAFARSGPVRQTISSLTPVLVDGLSISFTPKYASSLILIEAVVNGSSTYVHSLGVYKNGAATVSTSGYTNYNEPNMQVTSYIGSSSTDFMVPWPVIHYETAGSTTARTYAIYATSGWSGTPYATYINNRASNDMAAFSFMTVTEIAQ